MGLNCSAWFCFSAGLHFLIIVSIKMHKRQSDASSDHRQLYGACREAGLSLSANYQQRDEDEMTKAGPAAAADALRFVLRPKAAGPSLSFLCQTNICKFNKNYYSKDKLLFLNSLMQTRNSEKHGELGSFYQLFCCFF